MTEKAKAREIKKRILLKGKSRHLAAGDFAALLTSLVAAVLDPKIGFNHATTDLDGWLRSFAPVGVRMDEAFVEDMLYASNMLDELKKYKHPQGKDFQTTLRSILGPNEVFDLDTNSIKPKGKKND